VHAQAVRLGFVLAAERELPHGVPGLEKPAQELGDLAVRRLELLDPHLIRRRPRLRLAHVMRN
jgi:hypothetical protein